MLNHYRFHSVYYNLRRCANGSTRSRKWYTTRITDSYWYCGRHHACYAETSLAIYNNRKPPHEDADLFRHYQLRYVAAVRPSAFSSEMTPPHAANGKSHGNLAKELEKLGYCVYVTDRLPACFCGDATHRDRWFVIAFLSTGPNFSVFDYCGNCTTPAEAILDPVDQVHPKLKVMHPLVFSNSWRRQVAVGCLVCQQSSRRRTIHFTLVCSRICRWL